MKRYDLSKLKWQMVGWEANLWRFDLDPNFLSGPEIGPVPVKVPGSVQTALFEAGLIPDWNVGLNSYACEWVEHRHWELSTTIPAKWLAENPGAVRLVCQGLDYGGTIRIDGKSIAPFAGTLIPHVFDLTPHLEPGKAHRLAIMLEGAPDEQGQMGYTSKSHFFKPRFNYKWDWCQRLVSLGVWDSIALELGDAPRFDNVRPRATLEKDLKTGRLEVMCRVHSAARSKMKVRATLGDTKKPLARVEETFAVKPGLMEKTLKFPKMMVEAWNPNGHGAQPLYDLNIELIDEAGDPLDAAAQRVGFKRQRWLACEGAPKNALPWICEVNDNAVFLQGANWVPIRPNYADLTRADYAKRLKLYKKLGFNLLRVWGGGLIEKRDFYELCDELGMLVWQEFPLSSSGVENTPPSDKDAIADLCKIARSAIERRAGYVSLLQWCGGNELSEVSKEHHGHLKPWDERHPCLRALGEVVRELDQDHRFLPTSPQGPVFWVDTGRIGEGIHHNVHGPWKLDGTLEQWQDYWDKDDALFRSEFGCPSASPLDILEEFRGECDPWPPSKQNAFWRHRGMWWVDWPRFGDQLPKRGGRAGVAEYVRLSQELQARALEYAARCCKGRFPRMGGVIFWMGHDTFPCAANTSLIDYHGRPKPAAEAVAKVFKKKG